MQAVAMSPLDVASWEALAEACEDRGDLYGAQNAYTALLMLEPPDTFGVTPSLEAFDRASKRGLQQLVLRILSVRGVIGKQRETSATGAKLQAEVPAQILGIFQDLGRRPLRLEPWVLRRVRTFLSKLAGRAASRDAADPTIRELKSILRKMRASRAREKALIVRKQTDELLARPSPPPLDSSPAPPGPPRL